MPGQSSQFVSFLKLVQFPLHCTQMFISFTRLTKDIDFGHERVLSREVKGVYTFFFFLLDTVCFKMSFKLWAFLDHK